MTPARTIPDPAHRCGGEPSRADQEALARQAARHCNCFRKPLLAKALRQLANTLLPYLALCALMLWAAATGHVVLVLPLAVPLGGLLVRLFIIQHDCGHGSFLPSRCANDWLGRTLSLLTLTPYDSWKRAHGLHHATAGDLSRRGTGDVHTLTLREYLRLTRWGRLRYRLYRNPFVLIGLGSPLNFLVLHRTPFGMGLPWRTAWRSVLALDLGLAAALGVLAAAAGGVGPVLWVFLPILCVAAWIGGWLFYVQHQYEETVWEDAEGWDFHRVALGGSSYYVLPRVLQWFTGNVGLHHIHHLNSRIPNYRLQECLDGHALLGQVGRLTFRESLRCLGLALWDEDARKLVGFSRLRPLATVRPR